MEIRPIVSIESHPGKPDQMTTKFGKPTQIRIDVEGQEAAALRGGREPLRQFSPILFLALHNEMVLSHGGDSTAALDEIARLGYNTFSADEPQIDRIAIFRKPIIRIVARRRG